MARMSEEEMAAACRAEEDPDKRERMRAVSTVIHHGYGIADAARVFGCSGQSVRNWIGRFEGEGPDGLADRPR